MVYNSTKWKTTSHLKSLKTKKTTTFADGNPGPGFEQKQAQKCGRVKQINRIKALS